MRRRLLAPLEGRLGGSPNRTVVRTRGAGRAACHSEQTRGVHVVALTGFAKATLSITMMPSCCDASREIRFSNLDVAIPDGNNVLSASCKASNERSDCSMEIRSSLPLASMCLEF